MSLLRGKNTIDLNKPLRNVRGQNSAFNKNSDDRKEKSKMIVVENQISPNETLSLFSDESKTAKITFLTSDVSNDCRTVIG